MKKILPLSVLFLTSAICNAQTNVCPQNPPMSKIPFTTIVNNDFSKLIGISPGINFDYNSDKTVLKGTFGFFNKTKKLTNKQDATKGFYFQSSGSLGTTSTLLDLKQNIPQLDFSFAVTLTKVWRIRYFYDGCFKDNYSNLKKRKKGDQTPTGWNCLECAKYPNCKIKPADKFLYTDALIEKMKGSTPKIDSGENLFTMKNIFWSNISPEFGGSKYSFFDKARAYNDQFYNPYYQLFGIKADLNFYHYINNEDVKWVQGGLTTHFLYANISVRFGTNNNTDILKKSTINDILNTIVNPTTNATRQIFKSTNAYTGAYDSYTALTPSFEFLYSFSSFFAFDVFGNYNFITSQNTQTVNYGNIAGGLYFFTNENKSKVNIGIYYQRSISTTPSKEIIGIKTKIPIALM